MQSQKHTLGVRYMLISSSNFLLFPARILPLCEISRDRASPPCLVQPVCLTGKQVLPQGRRRGINYKIEFPTLAQCPYPEVSQNFRTGELMRGKSKLSGERSVMDFQMPTPNPGGEGETGDSLLP